MDITKIRLVISQPQTGKVPSEWDCTIDELMAEADKIAGEAATVKQAWAEYHATDCKDADVLAPYLHPGEKQCAYCKAKADCPALARLVGETVLLDFEVLKEPVPEGGFPDAADAVHIPTDVNLLSSYYFRVPLINSWVKAIEEKVYRMAMANEIGTAQGIKVVAGKRGNKAWDNDEEVEAMMKEMRLKSDVMYSQKIISPTVAEKVLSENPRKWKKLQERITQTDGSPTLAHISDKRPALNMNVADDFAPVEESVDDLL